MTKDEERRRALANFLRTRRERLTPGEVGLPEGSRRRTPGLRREEVALLANIGVSWYTSLEQGRAINPSQVVLESLAEALKLTATERQHLFTLAQYHNDVMSNDPIETVTSELQKLIYSLELHPAYIMGRRWDLIDWNACAELVFNFDTIHPPHNRNLLWRFFTTPSLKQHGKDWERAAKDGVARFRADNARYPGDATFAKLIQDLLQISEQFALWWSQHDVHPIEDGTKTLKHPQLGQLEFSHMTLQVPDNPDIRVIIYTPSHETITLLQQYSIPSDKS